jgi:hypothetical protein
MSRVMVRAAIALLIASICYPSRATERGMPKPLPEHPGNIFLAGEEIVVQLPSGDGAWRVVDYDSRVVAEGRGAGQARLGCLPVGYYELRCDDDVAAGRLPMSIGVLAPLAAPTPGDSPIACDVGMAWSCPEERMAAAASLCRLAGLNWVRDRLNWAELEKHRGGLPDRSRYDAATEAQSAAGLKILQVNHNTPAWANWTRNGRLPPDLRDAWRFYRAMAARWRGKVLAFEPWNEGDVPTFGGCTGSELAALQKASYLGLKAGNPDVIACMNVLALRRRATLDDFHANRAWPYFDTYNFHLYEELDRYPAACADHRAISAGRPMWLTEVNKPLTWSGDPHLKEPDEQNRRAGAERLVRIYALTLHEGVANIFFFYLPHYSEGQWQFGLLRADFTPRPGYLALAAVGRLLADARPLGRLKSNDEKLHVYAFRALPDGRPRLVLVAWSEGEPSRLPLPAAPLQLFDTIGRERKAAGAELELASAPLFAVLDAAAAEKLDLTPPPPPAPWLEGKPSPVVLQAVLSHSRVALEESALRISSEKPTRVPVYAYNFSDREIDCRLKPQCPAGWKAAIGETVKLPPGERVEIGMSVEPPAAAKDIGTIAIEGDCGAAGRPVLSLRLLPTAN